MATNPNQLRIDAPHLLTRRRRLSDAFVTGFMWLLYSYLWAPFISLVAWLLGFEFAYGVMVRAGGIHVLREVLLFYGVMVALIVIVVSAWSLINRYRFAGNDRRGAREATSDAEIMKFFGISQRDLQVLRESRVISVRVTDEGEIDQVEAGMPRARPVTESDSARRIRRTG